MNLALEGIRVVDFTNVVAGPLCTQLLSDMGAEVIKVEKVGEGDFFRTTSAEFIQGLSLAFLAFNRNKKSLTVDTTQEKGREVAFRLVSKADVVVENFRPGVMERLGLSYEELSKANPRLIFCSISGYGQSGPYRRKPGQDLLVQGLSGIMSLMGDPGGPPVVLPLAVCDVGAAMLAAWGITVALFARERSGIGQRVEASLLDSALTLQSTDAVRYLNTGVLPLRIPTNAPNPKSSPSGVFRTKDSHITINATSYARWTTLCKALGIEQFRDDERYNTLAKRASRTDEVRGIIEGVLSQKTTGEWLPVLETAGVLCSPVHDYDQVFADPQVLQNRMVATVNDPERGELKVIGVPVKLSKTPGRVRSAPPRLGQDADALLCELGYTTAEIEELRRNKTI